MLTPTDNNIVTFDDLNIDDLIAIKHKGKTVMQGTVTELSRETRAIFHGAVGDFVSLEGVGRINLLHHKENEIVRLETAPKTPYPNYKIIFDGEGDLWHWIFLETNNILTKIGDEELKSYTVPVGRRGSVRRYTTRTHMGTLEFKRRYPNWRYVEKEEILRGISGQ